jgi:type IX secretion system PorP/SprF family membrane protein
LKKIAVLVVVLVAYSLTVRGQDVPLFTQKLANSFLYNPSVAGNTYGSLTFSHRKLWSGVQDSPNTNLLSFHTPFSKHRMGVGVNFYSDNIGLLQNMYASSAFAYHIKIDDEKMFSLGVSGEYGSLRVNPLKADVVDMNDPWLLQVSTQNNIDFSFGMSYKSRFVTLGLSANKIGSMLNIGDTLFQFPSFYSGFVNFTLPAGEKHLFEPMINVRSFLYSKAQIDGGLYYTFNNMMLLGASYRSGGALSGTLGIKVAKRLLIGYSYDVYTTDIRKAVGASNEITIRIDFKDESFYLNTKNARAINTNAMAIRRKTITMYQASSKPMQKHANYKKKVSRNAFKSPNYRITASKKLMTQKTKSKKSGYKKRRR